MKVVESFQPRTCVDPRISKNDIAHFIRYKSKTYSFGVLSDEGLPCVNQIELMYIILSQDLLKLGFIDVGDGCWRRKFHITKCVGDNFGILVTNLIPNDSVTDILNLSPS